LPYEYERCIIGLNEIIKEAWDTTESVDGRTKIQALSLAKDAYAMNLDLLTNATVVDDVVRFVSSDRSKSKELKSSSDSSNEGDKEESKEPDYDKDKDQLEEEQEEETEKMAINQVF
jgi:hypothetical protein